MLIMLIVMLIMLIIIMLIMRICSILLNLSYRHPMEILTRNPNMRISQARNPNLGNNWGGKQRHTHCQVEQFSTSESPQQRCKQADTYFRTTWPAAPPTIVTSAAAG